MNNPEFVISFRIRHPNIDPDVVSKQLKLAPDTAHTFNEAKTTPKGSRLEGVYKDSYWSKKFDNVENKSLSDLINSLNNKISDYSVFLAEIVETGGKLEYFIGCFVQSHVGEVLDHKLLSECADLKISLAFDIYNDS